MKVGALDVGTNTVLMLVAEFGDDGRVHSLAEFSRITRLGRGVDRTGRLDPDTAARTIETIVEFAQKARALGAEKILTAATSALRDASDEADFIAGVKACAGVNLETISGKDEARLSYLAVINGLHINPRSRILIIDIGGGSTEFIRADPGADLEMASLRIGSVRLTERIVHHDPPAGAEASELRKEIDAAIDGLGWNFRPEVFVGIAGTVTTVCAVAMGMSSYNPELIHGHRLNRAQVNAALDRFGSVPLEKRKKVPGLVEGRADVIFAGTMILVRAMEKFGADSVVVSDQGVRWGLVWRELEARRAGS